MRSPRFLLEDSQGPENVVSPQAPAQTAFSKAKVIIDFGDKKRIFEGPIVNGQNAADVVKQAALVGKLDLKWNEIGPTPRLIGIGESANGSKFWSAYINGKRLAASLYETKVNPNDEILLVFK
ncbi:hypothetical protein A2608_03650 [Candidatus Azambacteria bacterium RIFOXYD1_FULL_44_10]|nr:MAG: hypothetical protein A2608_03650 [Candidatus Azambacteria bacterium RIFOXYD1_FULL_44_10]